MEPLKNPPRTLKKNNMIKNGRLTQIGSSFTYNKWGHKKAVFKCLCGNNVVVNLAQVVRGHALSCGCLKLEKIRETHITHGMSISGDVSIEYVSWANMKQRCLNSKNTKWSDYGGRGIKVCERWLVFDNFLSDMGKCPTGMTLDRTDNSKGYSPDNCRWATIRTQSRNKRNNIILTFNNKSMTITDWAQEIGISVKTLMGRRKLGWSDDEIINVPINTNIKQWRKQCQ